MITLRVVVDEMLTPNHTGLSRYTEELARALVTWAPKGCEVRGVVAASPEHDYDRIAAAVPGLAGLDKSVLARRELASTWQHGAARLSSGSLLHAPSLLAPLRRHDRMNDGTQIAATFHDATAWTAPELLRGREASWQRAMGERARKHADAVVVPSHAVAEVLAETLGIGDRIRVIPAAPGSGVVVPDDADERALKLGLPDPFVVGVGDLGRRKGLDRLLAAMALPDSPDMTLVIVGAPVAETLAAASAAGIADDLIIALGPLEDADLATVLDRADLLAVPSRSEGFGLTMLEAMSLGTPVVHSALPALDELAAGSAHRVELDDGLDAPGALLAAITAVADDREHARHLSIAGADRAVSFTWRGAAEQVWRLHADL